MIRWWNNFCANPPPNGDGPASSDAADVPIPRSPYVSYRCFNSGFDSTSYARFISWNFTVVSLPGFASII